MDLEEKAKEADQLKLQLLQKENEQLRLTQSKPTPKLETWKPLRWFLQESQVSNYLDQFTDRVNHRVIETKVFDREIKKDLEHMVKFNGKALLFNPEYENEILKIIYNL